MSQSQMMTVAEAARILGVTPAAVRAAADAGRLPVNRTTSGVRFFNEKDVRRFQKQRAAKRAAA